MAKRALSAATVALVILCWPFLTHRTAGMRTAVAGTGWIPAKEDPPTATRRDPGKVPGVAINCFNPETRIRFALPEEAQIQLCVYNALGQRIRTLANGLIYAAGTHDVLWDGRDDRGQPAGSGVFFCRLQSERFSQTRKMLLIR